MRRHNVLGHGQVLGLITDVLRVESGVESTERLGLLSTACKF